MAFVKIADLTKEVELILFPNTYQQTVGIWERDNVVVASGKVSTKDRDGNLGDEIKIMVDDAREVSMDQAKAYQPTGKKVKVPKPKKAKVSISPEKDELAKEKTRRLYIKLENTADSEKLESLKTKIDLNPGITEVVLVIGEDESKQLVKLPSKVNPNENLLQELSVVFGKTQVKLH